MTAAELDYANAFLMLGEGLASVVDGDFQWANYCLRYSFLTDSGERLFYLLENPFSSGLGEPS